MIRITIDVEREGRGYYAEATSEPLEPNHPDSPAGRARVAAGDPLDPGVAAEKALRLLGVVDPEVVGR